MKKRTKVLLLAVTLLAALRILQWNQSTAAQTLLLWRIEKVKSVDSCFDTPVSLALDENGMAHISYQDLSAGALMYARRSNAGWINEIVDNSYGAGKHSSIALDSSGHPHISYRNGAENALKYASWNGAEWEITTIGNNEYGWYSSLVIDSNDQAHISYLGNYEATGSQTPKYAFWNGSQWEISVIDEIFADGGTSLALDTLGIPHVSYHSFLELRYAVYSNTNWITETVDLQESGKYPGYYSSIALDDADIPYISYGLYASDGGFMSPLLSDDLKYAKKQDNDWQLEQVDTTGLVGGYSSLTLGAHNQSHISYFDQDNKALKYAYWNGESWEVSVVDLSARMNGYTSIKIDQNGQSHIAYCDEQSRAIKYATQLGIVASKIYLPVIID